MAGYKGKGGGGNASRGGRKTGGSTARSGGGNRSAPNKGGDDKDTPELAYFAKVKDEDVEYGYATIGAVKRWKDTGFLVLDINLTEAEKYVNERGYVDNVKLFEHTPK
jgi:hypothetical protein